MGLRKLGASVMPIVSFLEMEADHPVDDSRIASADRAKQSIVLEAGRAERNFWRDLWAYRELFVILAWRDVAVRYKQTVIGIAWAVVRPLLTTVIFTIVFSKVAKLPSDGAVP